MFHEDQKETQEFTMVRSLIRQLKKRRQELGLKQADMMMRVGISRQQYQRLESKGNPRLDTLELIATGLTSELMLIPKEKMDAVRALLENPEVNVSLRQRTSQQVIGERKKRLSDDPWQDILENDL